ncbi:MAG: lipid-A-disaccharide synthase [Candidatus Omnitrophica bacterium]|nr:lipid-A-disaccharide synthase [Candidatus Omnitrophota bacterium]
MAEKKILIVAGDPSGDLYAANLVKELKNIDPSINFFGLGGKCMQKEGVFLYSNIVELSLIGFWEVIKNFKKFKNIFNLLLERVDQIKPQLAILVDYPGFNLRLAKELKKRAISIIYYISPQVWAWGASRIKKIKDSVDLMLVFFKFEEDLYKEHNIKAIFVGHPLLDIVKPSLNREEIIKKFSLPLTRYTFSLLPGSRLNEVRLNLPIMFKTAEILFKKIEDVKFLILKPENLDEAIYYKIIPRYSLPIYILSNNTYNGLSISDFALVASGTATLETALLNIPMVIIYRMNFLNWLILRPLVKLPFIGMVNIVLGKKVVPEFIQYKAKPKIIADHIISIISDKDKMEQMKNSLFQIRRILDKPNATQFSAQIISKFLNEIISY